MLDEHELAVHPYNPESLQHNARVTANIRSLSASLFGVAAGTLGLESYLGFAFYIVGTLLVSVLLYLFRTEGNPKRYFFKPVADFWIGDVFGGAMSFVLTWTLLYGLTRV